MDDTLLAAVLAAPDDDAPRLVYADALIQRGDPWGEMIVISCELAHYRRADRRWDDRGHALVKRLDELQATRFPAAGLQLTFERGFCTEIDVRGGDLGVIAGPPFALLDSLVMRAAPGELERLAHWARLGELRKLRIEGHSERPRLREHVLHVVEPARALEALELSRTDVTQADIAELFTLPQVRRLRHLSITANASLGGLGLLDWPPLEELDLGACALRLEDVEQVIACAALRGLRGLDVSFNGISDPALAEAIAQVPWSRLEKLELLNNVIGASGLRALLDSPHLAGLATLALGAAAEGEDLTPALPGLASELPRLTRLQLRSRQTTGWLPAIARPYEHLDLELPLLDPAHLAALLAQPPLRALRGMWLSLRRMPGDDPAAADLGARLGTALAGAPLPDLASLFLDSCSLGEDGALALAQAADLPRELDLVCFEEHFGDAHAELAARFPYLQVY